MSFAVGTPVIAILEGNAFPATVHRTEVINGKNGYWVNFVGYSHQFNQWYTLEEVNIDLFLSNPKNDEKYFRPGVRGFMPTTTKRVPIDIPKPYCTKNKTRIPRNGTVEPPVKKSKDRKSKLDFEELITDDLNVDLVKKDKVTEKDVDLVKKAKVAKKDVDLVKKDKVAEKDVDFVKKDKVAEKDVDLVKKDKVAEKDVDLVEKDKVMDKDVDKGDTKTSKQEEPIFDVEDICSHRRRSNKLQFLVKWKDFDASNNTWEPLNHLQTAKAFVYRHLEECMLPELHEEVKKYYGDE